MTESNSTTEAFGCSFRYFLKNEKVRKYRYFALSFDKNSVSDFKAFFFLTFLFFTCLRWWFFTYKNPLSIYLLKEDSEVISLKCLSEIRTINML